MVSAAVEERTDMVCELLWVLIEEPVARIWVDPQLRVRQVLGEEVAVLGDHQRVVVACCNERRMGDRGEPRELGRLRDAPARERLQLGLASSEVSRCVAILVPFGDPLEELQVFVTALARAGEEQLDEAVRV